MRDVVILQGRSGGRTSGETADVPAAIAGLTPWVDDGRRATTPVLDLPHPNPDARFLFGRTSPIAIDALAWLNEGEALPAPWSASYVEVFRLTLRDHLGWPPPEGEAGDALDVVKQVSFLHASEGTGEEAFRAHYRHHVEIARRHMPALWQYVQNDVVVAHGDTGAATGIVAVSELWFRSTDDFLNRYFPSEKDQREFSSHEGFLDLSKATSFVCWSHRPTRSTSQP